MLVRGCLERGGVQHPEELKGLIGFLRGHQISTVLEIGTEMGGTLWVWCQLCDPDGLVISVDLEDGPYSSGGYKPEHIPRMTVWHGGLRLLRGDSHDEKMLASVKRFLRGREVDFLFIDGDHSLEGVTQDWEMYSPLVRPGGLVAFHDIVQHSDGVTEVKPLWDRLKESHEHYEFCFAGTWGGIGVLIRR